MSKLILTLAVSALSIAATAQTTRTLEEVRALGTQARIEFPGPDEDVWYDELDTVKSTNSLSEGKTSEQTSSCQRLPLFVEILYTRSSHCGDRFCKFMFLKGIYFWHETCFYSILPKHNLT